MEFQFVWEPKWTANGDLWPLPISTPRFPSFCPHGWHTAKHQLVTALGSSDGAISPLLTPAQSAVISSCSLPLLLLAAFAELSLHQQLGMTTCVCSREESPAAVSQDHTQMLAWILAVWNASITSAMSLSSASKRKHFFSIHAFYQFIQQH